MRSRASVIEADRHGTDLQKRRKELFRLLAAHLLLPHADDPFRHGVLPGEGVCPGTGGQSAAFFFADHSPHHAVDKAGQLFFGVLPGQFDCLVAGSRIRHRIHVKDLEDPHSKDIPDHGTDAGTLLRILSDNVIQLDPALRDALGKPLDKSPLSAVHSFSLAAVQQLLDRHMAVCSVLPDPDEDLQDSFSLSQSAQIPAPFVQRSFVSFSPGSTLAPSRNACVFMRFFPSYCTSRSARTPSPQLT